MKVCTGCGEAKQLTEYYENRNRPRSRCKDCYKKANRSYYAANREACRERNRQYNERTKDRKAQRDKANRIKRSYGLTVEQYELLIANGCYVCGSMENPHIDHDHSCCPTGKTCGKCIRGVLCGEHNRALGLFKDNVDHLRAAIAYLNK